MGVWAGSLRGPRRRQGPIYAIASVRGHRPACATMSLALAVCVIVRASFGLDLAVSALFGNCYRATCVVREFESALPGSSGHAVRTVMTIARHGHASGPTAAEVARGL